MSYYHREPGGEGYIIVAKIVFALFVVFLIGLAFGTGFEVARH
jgi:hypothetical protein